MQDFLQDTIESLWPGESPPPQSASMAGVGAEPGFRPKQTPSEARADETTRVSREITDAAAETRREKTGRLRQARLEREAQDQPRRAPASRRAK